MYSVGEPLCESAGLQQLKDCPCLLMNDKSVEVKKKNLGNVRSMTLIK